jgi:hypothetical protein
MKSKRRYCRIWPLEIQARENTTERLCAPPFEGRAGIAWMVAAGNPFAAFLCMRGSYAEAADLLESVLQKEFLNMTRQAKDEEREQRIIMEIIKETQQAIEDWHYWVNQGYEL